MKRIGAFVLLFLSVSAFSQNAKLDSLLNVLKTLKPSGGETSPTDTLILNALNQVGKIYYNLADYDKAQQYSSQAIALAENLITRDAGPLRNKFKKGLAAAFSNSGSIYNSRGEYSKGHDYHSRALKLRQEIGDEKGIADSYNNLGNNYWYQAVYSKALENYLKAMAIREKMNDKSGMETAYSNIGMIYKNQKNMPKAFEYYNKALSMSIELKDLRSMTICYHNIGLYYISLMDDPTPPKTALKYCRQALENHLKVISLSEKTGDRQALADGYYAQGNDYLLMGTYDTVPDRSQEAFRKCIASARISLAMCLEIKNRRTSGNDNQIIGVAFQRLGKLDTATVYLNRSLDIFKNIQYKNGILADYTRLSDLYEQKKDFPKALAFYKLGLAMHDTLANEATSRQITEMNAIYESEKKDKEIETLNKDAEHQARESHIQKLIIGTVSVALLLVLVFAIFSYISYRQKKEANKVITRQNEEALRKNAIIESQKLLVEAKNKDITDSINYAKLIQEAMLSAKEIKYKIFPDSFILFKPRDIVSGDFYWFSEKKGHRLIAAVDCTGHGVPGAFMSMIGNAFLNEIVNEKGETDPKEILSELRHKVIRSMRQSGSDVQSKDGMDIALLSFNPDNSSVSFSGANNPLWISRKTDKGVEMLEYEANKRPIGYYMGKSLPFMGHEIPLQKGDILYLFTDGYADQFGGPKGKKFKYKPLQELLLSMRDKSMPEQEKFLTDRFNAWKGDQEQVDDVLVIGVRV